jgi:hypothetical protein
VRTAGLLGLAVSFSGALAPAQTIRVVSEFTRIRPDGEVVSFDRGERVREILSPATARNAYATYRVVVEAPTGQPYTIHIGQNPESSCEVRLYQEGYARVGEEWVPDELTLQSLPVTASLPAGQKVQTYLLDLFIPEATGTGRFRVEVQIWANDRWTIYPMEIRPRQIRSPVRVEAQGPLPEVGVRADQGSMTPLREVLCQEQGKVTTAPVNARALLVRNVRQDLKVGESRIPSESFDGVAGMILKAGGWSGVAKEFCGGRAVPAPNGPEWWLKARDYLYQGLPVR